MNRKGEVNIGQILLLAIGIIVVMVFIQEIAVQQGTATTKLVSYNESDVLATCLTAPQGQVNASKSTCNITVDRKTNLEWQTEGCPLTSVVVRNATNSTVTADVDYVVFASTGIIALQNTSVWHNLSTNRTYIDYTFCPVGYNTDLGARNIASMWLIFAALALLAFVLVGVKDWLDN